MVCPVGSAGDGASRLFELRSPRSSLIMSRISDGASMSYKRIQEKLARGETVLLDGGVGTEILRRGVYWRCHGIEQHPEAVRQVHLDYLAAGADVIKTDTFQLNRRA